MQPTNLIVKFFVQDFPKIKPDKAELEDVPV